MIHLRIQSIKIEVIKKMIIIKLELSMKQSIFSIIILVLTSIVVYGQQNEFLYGLNVYPEYETQKQSIKSLDYMQKCGMKVVRLTDASWGNIETSSTLR